MAFTFDIQKTVSNQYSLKKTHIAWWQKAAAILFVVNLIVFAWELISLLYSPLAIFKGFFDPLSAPLKQWTLALGFVMAGQSLLTVILGYLSGDAFKQALLRVGVFQRAIAYLEKYPTWQKVTSFFNHPITAITMRIALYGTCIALAVFFFPAAIPMLGSLLINSLLGIYQQRKLIQATPTTTGIVGNESTTTPLLAHNENTTTAAPPPAHEAKKNSPTNKKTLHDYTVEELLDEALASKENAHTSKACRELQHRLTGYQKDVTHSQQWDYSLMGKITDSTVYSLAEHFYEGLTTRDKAKTAFIINTLLESVIALPRWYGIVSSNVDFANRAAAAHPNKLRNIRILAKHALAKIRSSSYWLSDALSMPTWALLSEDAEKFITLLSNFQGFTKKLQEYNVTIFNETSQVLKNIQNRLSKIDPIDKHDLLGDIKSIARAANEYREDYSSQPLPYEYWVATNTKNALRCIVKLCIGADLTVPDQKEDTKHTVDTAAIIAANVRNAVSALDDNEEDHLVRKQIQKLANIIIEHEEAAHLSDAAKRIWKELCAPATATNSTIVDASAAITLPVVTTAPVKESKSNTASASSTATMAAKSLPSLSLSAAMTATTGMFSSPIQTASAPTSQATNAPPKRPPSPDI